MKPEEHEVKPLVILGGSGRIVDVAWMNRKSFTKSTERGELWVVYGETGRVLPYEGGLRPLTLEDAGRWYEAAVEPAGGAPRRAGGAAAVGGREREQGRGAALSGGSPAAVKPGAGGAPEAAAGGTVDPTAVLRGLSEVIAQRRRERPEGSYTSYLFDSGEEKIRKKTGEEAIELVLARTRGETVSEAADLIYHLLVLLNQLEIPLDEVLAELEGRA